MPIDRPARARREAEASLPGSFLAELRALLAQGRPLEAIRRYRLETGAELAEAQAAVDRIGRGNVRVSLGGVLRLLVAFCWLCAGLAGLAAGWQAHERHVVNDRWPKVDAEVVKCAVVPHGPSRAGTAYATLDCQFRYSVAGVEHKAKTRSTGIASAAQEAAMHDFVAHHRPGSRQVVHYDPEDPRRISLGDADASFQADTPALRLRLAGLFAGGGVLFLVPALLLSRRRRNDMSED